MTPAGFVSLWKLLRGLNARICGAAAANKQETNKFPSIFSLDSPRFFSPIRFYCSVYSSFSLSLLPLSDKLFFPRCSNLYTFSVIFLFSHVTRIDKKLTREDFRFTWHKVSRAKRAVNSTSRRVWYDFTCTVITDLLSWIQHSIT
mgnify:CR=1 FL=1